MKATPASPASNPRILAGTIVLIATGSALLSGWISYRVGMRAGRLDRPVGAIEPAPVPISDVADIPPAPELRLEPRQGSPAARQSDTGERTKLRARIAELEEELAQLSETQQGTPPSASADRPRSPDEIAAAMQALNPNVREARKAQRMAEVELQREFLALYPDHPDAGKYLVELSNNLIFLPDGDPYQVLVDFEDKVSVPTARLEGLKANALIQSGRREEGIARYEQLTRDPRLSESEQCDNAFWHAYSVQQSGNAPEAIVLYRALLGRIGHDVPPELKSTVGGVKNQLEKLESRAK